MLPTRQLITGIICVTSLFVSQACPAQKSGSNLSWLTSSTKSGKAEKPDQLSVSISDPRFTALVHASLRQSQSFWRDEGRFVSVPDLLETFLAVPEHAALHEGRFVTLTGCVPHDCHDRGMVWIDTLSPASHPSLIFVATGSVAGEDSDKTALTQLWVFPSQSLNWQHLPPSFVSSVSAWWSETSKDWAKFFTERVLVVSLVQPSGEIVSLAPGLLSLNKPPAASAVPQAHELNAPQPIKAPSPN